MVMDPSPTYYIWCMAGMTGKTHQQSVLKTIALVDNCEQVCDVDEFDDAFANCEDAKEKMNALRNSRGLYPVVAMLPPHMSGQSPGGQARGKRGGK